MLPLTATDAERFGVLRAAVRDRRRDIMGRQIATHALSVGIILVTNDGADFKDYPGLTIEKCARTA